MSAKRRPVLEKSLWRQLPRAALVFFGYLLLLLGSCQQSSTPISSVAPGTSASFESLCMLSPEQLLEMDTIRLYEWLENNFSVTPGSYFETDDVIIYSWGTPDESDKFFGNAYVHENQVFKILLYNVHNAPNFGTIVADLGEPSSIDLYAVQYEEVLYEIGLDYPAVGVSVFMSESKPRQSLIFQGQPSVVLREDMLVDLVECYAPAITIEDVLSHDYSLTPLGLQTQLQSRLSWPGFGSAVPLSIP